jgi:hypothetical protein
MTRALCTNQTRLYLSLVTALVGSMVAFAVVPKAEETHHRFHDSDYHHWKQPGSDISCCSDRDCAPGTAELRKGQRFALRQNEWIAVPDEKGPGQWLTIRQSEWIAVPDEKIKPTADVAMCDRSAATTLRRQRAAQGTFTGMNRCFDTTGGSWPCVQRWGANLAFGACSRLPSSLPLRLSLASPVRPQ